MCFSFRRDVFLLFRDRIKRQRAKARYVSEVWVIKVTFNISFCRGNVPCQCITMSTEDSLLVQSLYCWLPFQAIHPPAASAVVGCFSHANCERCSHLSGIAAFLNRLHVFTDRFASVGDPSHWSARHFGTFKVSTDMTALQVSKVTLHLSSGYQFIFEVLTNTSV